MNYRKRIVIVSVVLVLVLGAITSRWQRSLNKVVEGEQSEALSSAPARESIGQGLSLAVLGGYRSIAANIIWLEMNGSWERREVDETVTKIELATATDPRAVFFWVNGARIIANDLPAWIVDAQGIDPDLNPVTMQAINRKFSAKALQLIEDGLQSHPGNVELMVDRAVIYWKKLKEIEIAAENFLEISKIPNGPYFAGRLYAELLVKLGRNDEALAYLRGLYPTLPDGDIRAMKPFVAERIRELENEGSP